MKKMFLVPLLCALLTLCGAQSAHAFGVTPLIDNTDAAAYVDFVNRFVADDPPGARLDSPVYDEGASGLAGHPVYTTYTQNGVSVSIHLDGENLYYVQIEYHETSKAEVNTFISLLAATLVAAGISQEEMNQYADTKSIEDGDAFIDRVYCAAAQRTLMTRAVIGDVSSSVIISAAPH